MQSWGILGKIVVGFLKVALKTNTGRIFYHLVFMGAYLKHRDSVPKTIAVGLRGNCLQI